MSTSQLAAPGFAPALRHTLVFPLTEPRIPRFVSRPALL